MLRGRFGDTTGRPFLEGHVQLTRLRVDFNISFLIDTGADRTIITPMEWMRMDFDYGLLVPGPYFEGLGGGVRGYEETAILSFLSTSNLLYSYTFTIGITPPRKPRRPKAPSPEDVAALLGRDILHRWRIFYNKSTSRLSIKVLDCDFSRLAQP